MAKAETILFGLRGSEAKAGLPPNHRLDSYNSRSSIVGKISGASKIAFSPDGELYVIRGPDLYKGPMPLDAKQDWFSSAQRVGKVTWDKFKCVFFHPSGILYASTKDGEFYKGPAPTNENVSWLYGTATLIGRSKWNKFDALFFDPAGNLHGVTDEDKLVMGSPPAGPDDDWLNTCKTIGKGGWRLHTHFITISPDNLLWCVNSSNGNIYKGPPPTSEDDNFIERAECLGWSYHEFHALCFTLDRTIQSVKSLEFITDQGKITSQSSEVMQTQVYKNRSGTPLRHKFEVTKTVTVSSSFTKSESFSTSISMETTFKTGIPIISNNETKISMDMSTTREWSLSKDNETQITFSTSTDVEVPAGKGIRMVASVTKGEMEITYTANIVTFFGYLATIKGVWKGAFYYNLVVSQEDYPL
uniref:Tachylectin 2 domain-containing protein n=1 Tax=Leptobrachium leishanense TaxID=445787 RepID=A0A8C5Q039_9ANUR